MAASPREIFQLRGILLYRVVITLSAIRFEHIVSCSSVFTRIKSFSSTKKLKLCLCISNVFFFVFLVLFSVLPPKDGNFSYAFLRFFVFLRSL